MALEEASKWPEDEETHTFSVSSSERDSAMDEGRFPPGSVIGQRYRVVSLLGRGGMGEVYRANDLLVGESVALKFLPETVAGNTHLVSRFRDEVRIARMVSHPNVCRVHDLGEAEGRLFLSMQFIDGEDLSSLLRRIGRLPEDKALEIAHKLCAGLHAAHAKGVIHRDLKPANIMIDGRGEVLITDFGLAGLAGTIRDAASGTPLYMSPEQRMGTEVTERSDIYSLGLVLHEMFTGKRPAVPDSKETTALNPGVSAVLDRCLNPNPALRPPSALAVSRALPGGDPLAAALLAGNTPAPEVVAAAGERTGLRPKQALPLLALAAVAPLLHAWMGDLTHAGTVDPQELRVRARDLVRRFDPASAGANEVWGLSFDLELAAKSRGQAATPHLSPHRFWFRTCPVPLGSLRTSATAFLRAENPPLDFPGMVLVEMDLHGKLVRYECVRGPRDAPSSDTMDWNSLLALSGIDPAKLTGERASAESMSGNYADPAGLRFEVDGLKDRGRLIRYRIRGDWEKPRAPSPWPWIIEVIVVGLMAFFAVRNIKLGRIDRFGATVLVSFLFLARLLVNLLRGNDLTHWNGFVSPVDIVGSTAFFAGIVGLGYLSVEPFVRRHWPSVLVTWTRLLHGGWKSPTVGRDILAGLAALGVATLFFAILINWSGLGDTITLEPVQNTPVFLAMLTGSLSVAIFRAVTATFLLFVLRLILRRDWAAGLGAAGLFAVMFSAEVNVSGPASFALLFLVGVVHSTLLLRFGFLAKTAAEVSMFSLLVIRTLNPREWYAPYSFLGMAWLAALALAAYWVATRGQGSGEPDRDP